MKLTKTRYLHSFTIIVVILALFRCGHDAFQTPFGQTPPDTTRQDSLLQDSLENETLIENPESASPNTTATTPTTASQLPSPEVKEGPNTEESPKRVYTRQYAVNNFKNAFPDSNDVQLVVAKKYGVKVVQNRQEAEKRKSELVYVGANPYFYVDKLRESIPYLVPRANTLLQDIGRAFYDSLYAKGVPLHKIIITSALRTEEDVARLRKHNSNASENSCHRFGTTFDICQNRYKTVQIKAQPRRQVTNDTLKWILSEVLRDMRERGRCYIKYEVHQGCFHITTR